jgi:hypothetical protein
MGWEKKYPILKDYKDIIDLELYNQKMSDLFNEMKDKYSMSNVDSVLVLKDILYQIYLKAR